MKSVWITLILWSLTTPVLLLGQNEGPDITSLSPELQRLIACEDSLIMLGDSLVQGSNYEVREASCVALIPTLVRGLKTEGSFDYPFDRLRTISVVQPKDGSFRIFTFQMELWDRTYRYFGAIQGNSKELELIPLIDASLYINPDIAQDTLLDSDNWYGALYYNVVKQKYKGNSYYFLFGLDSWDMFSTKKVMDVLWFDKKSDKVMFGAPLMHLPVDSARRGDKGDKLHVKRFILEYGERASVTLNYDPFLEKIIYDHLIPEDPRSEGIKSTYISDGTYEGFEWTKSGWKHIPKVFNLIMESAPEFPPVETTPDPFKYKGN